ncbi:MAG: hypothetical protein Q8P30_00615 [Candidatus Uhrbacteria bacterium]|nr:hypothetical protein [Candidatus Uhrbacteria bacterium]
MKNLKKHLKETRKSHTPSRDFQNQLAKSLNDQFSVEYPATVYSWKRAFVLPVVLVMVVATMGMGTYAYASPSVSEGHVLNPFKKGIEAMEARLPRSSERAAEFHARMMERRIDEGEAMLNRKEFPKDHLERIAEELNVTFDELMQAKKDPEYRDDFMQRMRSQNQRYENLLGVVFGPKPKLKKPESPDEVHAMLGDLRTRIANSDLSDEEKRAMLPPPLRMYMPKLGDEFERPEDFKPFRDPLMQVDSGDSGNSIEETSE